MLPAVMNKYFLEKLSSIILLLRVLLLMLVAAQSKRGLRENMDWIFSDVGVLCMNRWNGLDNDALKEFSTLQ